MTRQEILEMCRRMDIPFDENHPDHIAAGRFATLQPPFMEYTLTDVSVIADGVPYIDIKRLDITLWSDTEECAAEASITGVLEAEELRWKTQREYIEESQLWAIIYNLEV